MSAKTSVSEFVTQIGNIFVSYISDEANNICTEEEKKTITPMHVIKALEVI